MRRARRRRSSAALLAALLLGCATEPVQLPLTGTNFCTSSPDLGNGRVCCAEHDLDYSLGGDETDRWISDTKLAMCLATWNVPLPIVKVYFKTVRRFGKSHWHYGPPRRIGAHRR